MGLKATQIDKDYKEIRTERLNVVSNFQIAGTQVTSTAAELNALDGITATVTELNKLDGVTATFTELNEVTKIAAGATITLDAEGTTAANTIRASVQLEDADGNDVAEAYVCRFYISDDSGGDGLCATAPDNNIAAGAVGTLLEETTTDKSGLLLTDATGAFDLDISDTGTPTFYLVIVLPNGTLSVSAAITFA